MSDENIHFDLIDDDKNEPTSNELEPSTSKEALPFVDRVKKYVSENKIKLWILTPCYGCSLFVNYVVCMMATKELFDSYGIQLKIDFC